MRYRGAQHDLYALVKTHLFILSCNNSGSTFLERAISTSDAIWSLHREGQHVTGFHGPASRKTDVSLIWAAAQTSIAHFSDPTQYTDWDSTKAAWYFQATASHPSA